MADRTQLDIETQINAAIQARAALQEEQKKKLVDQIALAQELCHALECKELDGYADRIEEARQGLLDVADAGEKTTESQQDMTKALQKNKKAMFSWKAAAVGAAVAVKMPLGRLLELYNQ